MLSAEQHLKIAGYNKTNKAVKMVELPKDVQDSGFYPQCVEWR